jgi:(4-O-methyl)-D-glucuronate---lignin esterase
MSVKQFLSMLIVLALAIAAAACAPGQSTDLERQFVSPPDSARPWVYWMWMDGNLSREGITADLEAMKQAGIGGVIICEVNVGVPRGPVEFMSPEWRKLFTHVVREAERLGLEITLNAGPGWTGSGGPWIKPEQSMQHLVASAVELTGPQRFEGPLPRPRRRPAFFGDGALPAELEKAKNEFYLDVAVLAFPSPAGEARLADIDEKALYVRAPYSSQPGVKPFLPLPAEHPSLPAGAAIEPASVIDLSGRLSADGRLAWDVPDGRWTILRFGRTTNGANTRPAPVPGLGLECDKFDRAALDFHFESFIRPLLREIGPHRTSVGAGWTFLHIDSWEMGAQNWTAAFRDEFRRRRGYDLLPFLPALTGRVVRSFEVSERFLWDLRRTAQELVIENHAGHLRELGRRHGFGLSIEPYDMTPCPDMALGTVADVPMGEFWLYGFNTAHSVIEAVSIAHTCGRRVVAAEAFTSSEAEAWKAHPASMKALGDWALAAGINRIVFHRYQHQPRPDLRPGLTMGPYGVHWERTQTWWEMAPAYHTYLSRCQHMLRRGLPVADICYLAGEGAPFVFRPPATALRGDPPDRLGYNFDGCAPETLLAGASVENGRIVFPGGMSYRVLVLPEQETMTPALLRKIKRLVEAGATVIGPPPGKSPSLSGFPACDDEIRRLAEELWGNCDGVRVKERGCGRGRIIREKRLSGDAGPASAEGAMRRLGPAEKGTWDVGAPPLAEPEQYGDFAVAARFLERTGIPPDFEADARLRYAHRRDGKTDIYFVSNSVDECLGTECVFRVCGRLPELWDAVTGEIRRLDEFAFENGRTSVPLRFEPHQSFFIVFRKETVGSRRGQRNFPVRELAGDIGGPWEVAFNPAWGGPQKIQFSDLEDWSRRPEEGIKFYSGSAVYRKTFDLPPDTVRRLDSSTRGENPASRPSSDGPTRLWLDLGTVKNIARLRLNGRDLGVVWCAPWRVEITGAVNASDNRLEITVANLWVNRLIGDEQQPPDCEYGRDGRLVRWPEWLLRGERRPSRSRLTFATWKHYSKDSPLLPSGLLGPVTIWLDRPL